MSKTTVKIGKDMAKGASVVDPTRASKPAAPTYRYPLAKGLPALPDKLDADGNAVPLTGYARNQFSGPSSVSVTDSASMNDYDNLATPKNDAALRSLQVNGHGDQSGENSAVADLQRKIDTTGYPAAHGMRSRSGEGGTVPGSVTGNEAPLPKRSS
jgi:hypothetical protein